MYIIYYIYNIVFVSKILGILWCVLSRTDAEYPPYHPVITPKSPRNHPLFGCLGLVGKLWMSE